MCGGEKIYFYCKIQRFHVNFNGKLSIIYTTLYIVHVGAMFESILIVLLILNAFLHKVDLILKETNI